MYIPKKYKNSNFSSLEGTGAATGAAIGTIIPGAGTVVGGIIGGAVDIISSFKKDPTAWAKSDGDTKGKLIDQLIYDGIWKNKRIAVTDTPNSLTNYVLEQLKALGQGDYQYMDFYAKNDWITKRMYFALGASADGGTVINKDLSDRLSAWYHNGVNNPPPPPSGVTPISATIAGGQVQKPDATATKQLTQADAIKKGKLTNYLLLGGIASTIIIVIVVIVVIFKHKK